MANKKKGTRVKVPISKLTSEPPSKVQEFIRNEMERERDADEFPPDGEFLPPELGGSRYLESARGLASDERVIDELLASVPQNQGFYLKLYKELRPNDFELKLRIDNYSNWSDMEWEVTSLVRSYTLKDPKKWGTGRYRIIIWRDGGIRGDKFRPLDFFVDAMEPEHTDPPVNTGNTSGDMLSSLEGINAMIKTMREVNPTVSPADMQKTMAESFSQGMRVAADTSNAKSSENNSMMTAMMGFMGALIQTLKPNTPTTPPQDPVQTMAQLMAIIEKSRPATPTESFTDQILKLREIGLIEKPEKSDPISKLTEMKSLMTMFADFSGAGRGERPGLMEKIIETVGPQIPGMISNITNTVRSVVDYRMMREGLITKTDLARSEGALPQSQLPPTRRPVAGSPNPATTQTSEEQSMLAVKALLNELHQIVTNNDESKFQYIAERITQLFGSPQVLHDLASGAVSPDTLINQLKAFGGEAYQDAMFLVSLESYFNRFIGWLKQAVVAPTGAFSVICSNPSCNAIFDYDTETEFDNDTNKNCDQCGGSLMKPHSSPDVVQ